MARTVALATLLATVITLALPFPSHAGFRSGFVTGFPIATFSRPSFVLVNRSFASFTPFGFASQRIFVREVIVPRAPVVVLPVQRVIFISQPVFVTPLQPLFVSSRCFFDQFGVLRCFP